MDIFILSTAADSSWNSSSTIISSVTHSSIADDVTTDDVTGTTVPLMGRGKGNRDGGGDIISKQTLKIVEDVIFLGFNWILLFVGVAGNGLSGIVFWRQGFADRMNICLFTLSLVDFCCVVSWFIFGSAQLLTLSASSADPSSREYYMKELWKWTVRKYVRGLHRGFLFSSGCLVMLISVERCLCVWLPLRAANLVGIRTTTVSVLSTVLLVHLLHLVYPFKFDVVSVFDTATNQTVVTTIGTRLYRENQELFEYLENVVVMTILPFVTFSVVLIATILTVIRLMKVVKWRKQGTVASDNSITMNKAQMSLVKMLLVVSLIYIITSSPKIMLGLVRLFVPEFWRTRAYTNIFQATHLIYLALGTFNSTVNLFVYYNHSSRFRAELKRLCHSSDHVRGDSGHSLHRCDRNHVQR